VTGETTRAVCGSVALSAEVAVDSRIRLVEQVAVVWPSVCGVGNSAMSSSSRQSTGVGVVVTRQATGVGSTSGVVTSQAGACQA